MSPALKMFSARLNFSNQETLKGYLLTAEPLHLRANGFPYFKFTDHLPIVKSGFFLEHSGTEGKAFSHNRVNSLAFSPLQLPYGFSKKSELTGIIASMGDFCHVNSKNSAEFRNNEFLLLYLFLAAKDIFHLFLVMLLLRYLSSTKLMISLPLF